MVGYMNAFISAYALHPDAKDSEPLSDLRVPSISDVLDFCELLSIPDICIL